MAKKTWSDRELLEMDYNNYKYLTEHILPNLQYSWAWGFLGLQLFECKKMPYQWSLYYNHIMCEYVLEYYTKEEIDGLRVGNGEVGKPKPISKLEAWLHGIPGWLRNRFRH